MEREYMSAQEIRKDYAEAKDKVYQLQVLADMNFCTVDDIKKIISGVSDEVTPVYERRGGSKAKLTDEECRKIIEMHEAGSTQTAIANKIGRSLPAVNKVINAYKNGEIDITAAKETNAAAGLLSEPMRNISAAEIADKIMTMLMTDLGGYVIEIKATKEDYTVRVLSDEEEVIHRRRVCL